MSDEICHDIVQLIDRLGQHLRQQELEQGLSPLQWDILRYLSRANRFSRQEATVIEFLNATGLARASFNEALEKLTERELVKRQTAPAPLDGEMLSLTLEGAKLLYKDPLVQLSHMLRPMAPSTQEELFRGMQSLVRLAQAANGRQAFGVCKTCRFFARNAAKGMEGGPHRCNALNLRLRESDSDKICADHQPPPTATVPARQLANEDQ